MTKNQLAWANALLLLTASAGCTTEMPIAPDAATTTDAPTTTDAASATMDGGGADAGQSDVGVAIDATPDARRRRDAGTAACTLANETAESPGVPADWTFHTIDAAVHPNAVCNDGTPATYVMRRNSSSNRWLIFIKGGGQCSNDRDCQNRWRSQRGLMTNIDASGAWRSNIPTGGIFSTNAVDNPVWARANIVIVAYCSSDGWSGDVAGNPSLPVSDAGRWHFRGHEIVESVVSELLADEGLADAADVTLAGGSAGGVGVYMNADDVAARMPAGVRFLALPDAGFQLNEAAFGAAAGAPTPFEELLREADALWGGRGDASCVDTAPAAERALCRSSAYLLSSSHIATTMMSVVSQMDVSQTERLGVDTVDRSNCVVSNAAQATYVRNFATGMRALTESIDPTHSTFVDYTCHHVLLTDSPAYSIDGVTLPQAIAAFHARPCDVQRRIEAPLDGAP